MDPVLLYSVTLFGFMIGYLVVLICSKAQMHVSLLEALICSAQNADMACDMLKIPGSVKIARCQL